MQLPLDNHERKFVLSSKNAIIKRCADVVFASALLIVLGPVIVIFIILAAMSTGASGLFSQTRAGLYGLPFTMYKIRSMKLDPDIHTTITSGSDPRITPLGKFLRRSKIDEFPQLINVLKGDMSFVGPRPELIEVYEKMDMPGLKEMLCLRPGITSPVTIDSKQEEKQLETVDDPESHNLEVVVPMKVRRNLDYIKQHSFLGDVKIMYRTVFG